MHSLKQARLWENSPNNLLLFWGALGCSFWGQLPAEKPGFAPTFSATKCHRLACEVHDCVLMWQGGEALPRPASSAQRRGERGFVSNNDIIDSLEQGQGRSTPAIGRNRLKPSVCYGTEPLVLQLASLLALKPGPEAFCRAGPAKSRLFYPVCAA